MRHASLAAIAAFQIAGCLAAPAVAAATLSTVYSFTGAQDGWFPQGIVSYNGAFYGVTVQGGDYYYGTVFKVDQQTGQETTLHSFNGPLGENPSGQMTVVGSKIYGTAPQGDPSVFVIDGTTDEYSQVVDFGDAFHGIYEIDGNLINVGGQLFGTSPVGGANNYGTLFSVDPTAKTYSIVYNFATTPDASYPGPGLIYYAGSLYGLSPYGGSNNHGAIYKIDPLSGTETVLYSFLAKGNRRGASPLVSHGNVMYGELWQGSFEHEKGGLVFSFNMKTSKYKTLHVYRGRADGAATENGLTYWKGSLYGATTGDGPAQCGSIFKMDPDTGATTVLYTFLNGDDGCYPSGQLLYQNGSFYGVAALGGHYSRGTIFKLTP